MVEDAFFLVVLRVGFRVVWVWIGSQSEEVARGKAGYLLYMMKLQLWSIRGGDQTCTDRIRHEEQEDP